MKVNLGRGVAATAVAVGLCSMPIQLIFGKLPFELRPDLASAAAAFAVAAAGFGLVAWLTLPTQSENRLVWLLTGAASFAALAAIGTMLASLSFPAELATEDVIEAVSPAQLPTVGAIGVLIIHAAWVPGLLLVAVVGLLLFPDGRPIAGWGWLVKFNLVLVGLTAVFSALASLPNSTEPVARSLPEYFSGGLIDVVAGLLFFPLMVGGVLAVVALARSYRSSSGTLRHQIQWIAFGGGAIFVGGVLRGLDILGPALLGMVMFIASFYVAITKYRLYDIDVVISKSVTYVGLATAITLLYAVVVVVPLLIVGLPDERGPGLALPIAATAVVAVLFEPIRSRLQRWANRLVYGERSTPHEVLSQVTARLAETTSSDSTRELARLLVEGTGADHAVVWLQVDDTLHPEGVWPPDEMTPPEHLQAGALIDDEFTESELVSHGGEVFGAVRITKPRNDAITPSERQLLADVAAGAGLLLRNISLNRQLEDRARELRESRRRLITAQDAERHRLERDLHDGAQQQVVALKVKLGIARTLAEREEADEIASQVTVLADETQQAVEAMRRVAHGIYPPLLEAEGLGPALLATERSAANGLAVETAGLVRYPREVEATAYFCVVEAAEHARLSGASFVRVSLRDLDGQLVIEIEHDGSTGATELASIADRTDVIGGHTQVETVGGQTRITSRMPTILEVR